MSVPSASSQDSACRFFSSPMTGRQLLRSARWRSTGSTAFPSWSFGRSPKAGTPSSFSRPSNRAPRAAPGHELCCRNRRREARSTHSFAGGRQADCHKRWPADPDSTRQARCRCNRHPSKDSRLSERSDDRVLGSGFGRRLCRLRSAPLRCASCPASALPALWLRRLSPVLDWRCCLLKAVGVTADLTAGLLVFALGCELYLFLSTLSLASISSNILAFLREKPATEGELAARYSGWRMAEIRVERLLAGDFIAPDGDRLRLTPRGRKTARTFHRLRSFFRHRPLRQFEANGVRSSKQQSHIQGRP